MTPFAHAKDAGAKAKRVTIASVCKVATAPSDSIVVCLWALTGLIGTFLLAGYVGSANLAAFLAAAG